MSAPQMKQVADDVQEALVRVGKRMSKTLRDRTEAQKQRLGEIIEETRERDRVMHRDTDRTTRDANVDVDAAVGNAASNDYRRTFRDEKPDAMPGVGHHAVEQNMRYRYENANPPLVFTREELDSLENLRGVPANLNSDVHLSGIRRMWNQFHDHYSNTGTTPTKQDVLDFASLVDDAFGDLFDPPVR